jgi:hypothetical protein
VIARALAAVAIAASLAGCAPDLTALANDPSAICADETSVWVNVKINRNHGCDYPPPGFTLVPLAAAK